MKICVLGAGSLGCTIGAALAEAGEDVWLINRSATLVEALQRQGLVQVLDDGSERPVPVRAATSCVGLPAMDLLLVLVKSFHTRVAIEQAVPVLGPHTVVLSLQNGLGHEEVLAPVVGAARLLAGKTYVGGMLVGDGRIVSRTAGRQTFIGELDGSLGERVQGIAAAFNRAGLATTVSRNIQGVIWDKLLVNVATGALSGITGLSYGPLYAVPEIKATALAAVAEAIAVARAAGVRLSITDPAEAWRLAGAGLQPGFKASMLQSLEKGSRTEIDFVNGAVVAWGARLGVATPVNATLVACIKGIEHALVSDA
jgi:2-dehydropantoate 2-reductase